MGVPVDKIPTAWDVKVGSEAVADILKAQAGLSVWPQFFAFKSQKFFARAPYDVTQNRDLKERIANTRPFIEQLGGAPNLVLLDSTLALMELNLDSLGYRESFVPRRDFIDAISDLKVRISGAGERLEVLKALILAAYSRKKLDEPAIAAVRDRFKESIKSGEAHRENISRVFTALELNEREIEELQRGSMLVA